MELSCRNSSTASFWSGVIRRQMSCLIATGWLFSFPFHTTPLDPDPMAQPSDNMEKGIVKSAASGSRNTDARVNWGGLSSNSAILSVPYISSNGSLGKQQQHQFTRWSTQRLIQSRVPHGDIIHYLAAASRNHHPPHFWDWMIIKSMTNFLGSSFAG